MATEGRDFGLVGGHLLSTHQVEVLGRERGLTLGGSTGREKKTCHQKVPLGHCCVLRSVSSGGLSTYHLI